MKKLRIIVLTLLSAVCALCFITGCGDGLNIRGGIKVTYDLCGGKYKNSTAPIVVYYRFPEGVEKHIKALPVADNGNDKPEFAGNNFDGWYTDSEYKTEWNFETDVVGEDGVTLYAKWSPKTEYNYAVGYKDENGEFITVSTVKTYATWTFAQSREAILSVADNREGYTFLKKLALDEEDEKTYFDGGKIKESSANVLIKVYAEYIKGDYFIVSSYDDFKDIDGYSDTYKGKTVLLMNDVDCGGKNLTDEITEMFRLDGSGVPKYNGITSYDPEKTGVRYKLSNFEVQRGSANFDSVTGTLTASLFLDIQGGVSDSGKIAIENVEFADFEVVVDPWFTLIKRVEYSLFARNLQDVTIENVNVSGKFVIDNLMMKRDGVEFSEADKKYCEEDGDGVTINGFEFGEFRYFVTETVDGKEVFVASDKEGNKV